MLTQGIQSHTNFLHTLYHLKGEAFAEQLFGLLGVSTSGGYRLLSQLRNKRLIAMTRGKLMLTDFGRKMCENKITLKGIEEMRMKFVGDKCCLKKLLRFIGLVKVQDSLLLIFHFQTRATLYHNAFSESILIKYGAFYGECKI